MSRSSVRLVDLTADEYDAYMKTTLVMYAREVAIAGEMSAEAAARSARDQIGGLLPDGQGTTDHDFKRILTSEGQAAGHLWIGVQRKETPPRLFLYDIVIDESARGRGLGTATLDWIEAEARRLELGAVVLSVMAHNTGAIRFYERMGYAPLQVGKGGMSMIKHLDQA